MIAVNARFLTQNTSGVQRYATEVASQLSLIRDDIEFFSPPAPGEETHRINSQSIGNLRGHLWEQWTFPRFLKQKDQPLLVNLCNTAPLFYRNQIVTIHDVAFFENPAWFSKSFTSFYRYLIPKLVQTSKRVVTVSEFSKKEISKHCKVSLDKIDVIYGAPAPLFVKADIPREKFILAVGSLDPRKNLSNLIKAFASLEREDYRLVILGRKNPIFRLPDLKASGRVEFVDSASDEQLLSFYQRASLFVFPSYYEGFGLPPLEAMACGTPVISSQAASLPEVLGDAALYVAPDARAIAGGIRSLLESPQLQEELASKGHEQSKKYSFAASAEKYSKLIDRVSA